MPDQIHSTKNLPHDGDKHASARAHTEQPCSRIRTFHVVDKTLKMHTPRRFNIRVVQVGVQKDYGKGQHKHGVRSAKLCGK